MTSLSCNFFISAMPPSTNPSVKTVIQKSPSISLSMRFSIIWITFTSSVAILDPQRLQYFIGCESLTPQVGQNIATTSAEDAYDVPDKMVSEALHKLAADERG